MRRSLPGRGVALACLLSTAACYSYTPVRDPVPGTVVRAMIPVRSAAQGRGPEGSAVLEGTVVSSGDSVRIETRNRQQAGFMQEMLLVDTVRIAFDDLIALDERAFSPGRTAVLTAGIIAGTALVAFGITSVVGGNDGDGPPGGGDPAQRVGPGTDVFRIRLPLGGR